MVSAHVAVLHTFPGQLALLICRDGADASPMTGRQYWTYRFISVNWLLLACSLQFSRSSHAKFVAVCRTTASRPVILYSFLFGSLVFACVGAHVCVCVCVCKCLCVCVCAGQQSSQIGSPPEEVFDASRQRCHADGDHNMTTRTTCSNSTLAEELLRELTLYGPGSPDFSLADVDR